MIENNEKEVDSLEVDPKKEKERKKLRISKLVILVLPLIGSLLVLIFDHNYFLDGTLFAVISIILLTSCALFFFIKYYKKDVDSLKKIVYLFYSDLIDYFNLVCCLMVFFFGFIAPGKVEGYSMKETLNPGNAVLVYHFAYTPKRNDVVVVDMSVIDPNEKFFIKRVQGVPGDTLSFKSYGESHFELSINDKLLGLVTVTERNRLTSSSEELTYVIPKGKYLVIGDNYGNSLDSRRYGLIDQRYLRGKAFFVMWPMKGL